MEDRCEIHQADRDGHIGTIVLDRPKKRNALSNDLVAEVIAVLPELEQDGARVAVLRAQAGARVWSAVRDVGELPEGGRDPLSWDDPLRNLVRTIETCLRVVKEPAFIAAPIPEERAERIGMINHVVAAEKFEAFTFDMATTIANNAPLSIAVMKEQLRVLAGTKPVSPRGFEKVQGLRRIVYDSHDCHEGIHAFKEKRKPVFIGK